MRSLGKLRLVGRANPFNSGGGIYHVTHRCHNRGRRRRYRLLDLDRLCWRLSTDDAGEIRPNLEAALADAIARGERKREAFWTESLAVGSAGFVEKAKPMVLTRRETEVADLGEGLSVLQEMSPAYGQETDPKSARNVANT